MRVTENPASAESRFVDVLDSRMHYLEAGSGAPILFLHGNPTSSALWRNVIPHLAPLGRCIAPDLIGMGRSGRPDLAYRFFDHERYLAAFIEGLALDGVTLVVHDWGSALGFHWFRQHPARVRALAFMEAILAPLRWAEFPFAFRIGFRVMRAPLLGWLFVSVMNGFVEQILPRAVVRRLDPEDMARYRAPFPTIASRRPVRQWPREIPIDGRPADVAAVVDDYSTALQTSALPKLLIHGRPGGVVRAPRVAWCRAHLPQLEVIDIGPGIHFLQEDAPDAIGRALADWYRRLAA